MAPMPLRSGDLVLCSGTLARGIAFTERLDAARAGGFAGLSLWGLDYREARDSGLGDADLTLMLEDRGLSVAEIDPIWSWLPGADEVRIPAELDHNGIFQFNETDLFAVAERVGARSLNAVDVFGGTWTLQEAVVSFAALCRRAAEHGLLVHLEFLPWSRIPDLKTAWQIVREAGEANGGLTIDAWHYFRGTPDDQLLRTIPGDRIFAVQLSDAPARAESDPVHATLHERLLPGDGQLDLGALIGGLDFVEAECPIGVEVFSDTLHALPPSVAARMAGDSARRVLNRQFPGSRRSAMRPTRTSRDDREVQ